MKLNIGRDQTIGYDFIPPSATVQDFLCAIDEFLAEHPLPCGTCDESCCKKNWAFGFDNISCNRICGSDLSKRETFIKEKLAIRTNYFYQFRQYTLAEAQGCAFITEANRCTIYENRPLVCRLFLCGSISLRYQLLRSVIAGTFLEALALEEELKNSPPLPGIAPDAQRNPAVYAKNYFIPIKNIIRYAAEEGWLDPKEAKLLSEEEPSS